MHYLELDALYVLNYMMELAPDYRKDDIMKAVNKYADLVSDYYRHCCLTGPYTRPAV